MSAMKLALVLMTGATLIVCVGDGIVDGMRWWQRRQQRGHDLNFLDKVVRPNVRRVK